MRNLRRNQQKILYALLNAEKPSDEWGNTVDIKGYGPPIALRISVSANKGETSAQPFGTDLKYDREMVTFDKNCPIDEYSHLWIDVSKNIVGRTKVGETVVGEVPPYNYEVAAVSRSLNCIRYAIRRVNVNEQSYQG